VFWNNRYWCLLFFRDYRPVGLNLANGGSQNESEFTNPLKLMLREFSEEVIVLDKKPEPSHPLTQIGFSFSFLDPRLVDRKVIRGVTSKKFTDRHRRLRRLDGLDIGWDEESERTMVHRLDTNFSIKIRAGEKDIPLVDDVVFSVNAPEAGIECISIYYFHLGEGNYPIHGEISEWGFLLRRPYVLLSLDYLRGVFDKHGSLGKEVVEEGLRDRVYLGGKRLPSPIPSNAFHVFKEDIAFAKTRRDELAGRKTRRGLNQTEQKELDFLSQKAHTTFQYFDMLERVTKFKDFESVDLSTNEELVPFFTLNPVVWRTLETAFRNDIFARLPLQI